MNIVTNILKYPRLIALFIISMAIAMSYTPQSARDDSYGSSYVDRAEPDEAARYTSSSNPWSAD